MKAQPYKEEAGYQVVEHRSRRVRPYSIHPYKKANFRTFYFFKQVIDLLLSIILILLVLSWLVPILCMIVLWDSGFPIFFIQKRVGFNEKVFFCYKFRTMRVGPGSEAIRTTRIGQFLRDHKLDELPQILNVLRGEMSLVGPRPHMLSDHEVFSQAIGNRYHLRHCLKPGITGLAQISGYEGRITSHNKLRGRIKMDLFYIKKWTLGLDFLIIFKTIEHIHKGIRRRPKRTKKPLSMVHQERNG